MRIPTTRLRSRPRLVTIGAIFGCLLIRSLVPAGYMPGNLLGGEYMVLCPASVPAEFAALLHRDHDDHTGRVVDADRACPIGQALKSTWISIHIPAATSFARPGLPAAEDEFESHLAPFTRRYRTRAPPAWKRTG